MDQPPAYSNFCPPVTNLFNSLIGSMGVMLDKLLQLEAIFSLKTKKSIWLPGSAPAQTGEGAYGSSQAPSWI